jgi:hypothetical protein
LTIRELLQALEQAGRPIDFDGLVARGVLRKAGSSYILLKAKELPEHAWRQVGSLTQTSRNGRVTTTKVYFRRPSKSFTRLRARWLPFITGLSSRSNRTCGRS